MLGLGLCSGQWQDGIGDVKFYQVDISQLFGTLVIQQQYLVTMFHYQSSEQNIHSPSNTDLQYQICSQFMKNASTQLLHKQIELIHQTDLFIQRINDNLLNKDISTTQESFTLDSINDQEDVFAPSRSKLLLRKSQSNLTLRRTQSGVGDAMGEVRRKCSQKTVAMLNNIVNEAKKSRQKVVGYDRLEKELKRVQNKFHMKEEQLFILKRKLKDLQENYHAANEQVSTLKFKLRQNKASPYNDWQKRSQISQSTTNVQISTQGQKLKKYLEQKQEQIERKQKGVRALQDKLQQSFENKWQQKCEKCCQIMKKIKESILKYRNFLQQESLMAQGLYQNYKQAFS